MSTLKTHLPEHPAPHPEQRSTTLRPAVESWCSRKSDSQAAQDFLLSNVEPDVRDLLSSYGFDPGLGERQHPDQNFNRPSYTVEPAEVLHMSRDETEIMSLRNTDWCLVHCVEYELAQGDTLVFVDLPKPSKDAKKQADCRNIPYRCHSFLVHSEKLLATGSSYFKALLRPSYQSKLQSRRRIKDKLPEGVRYVLDLTPPSEGDELVFQMTELSLTPGIMRWWSSYKFLGVDSSLVSGHDDVCTCRHMSRGSLDPDADEEFGRDGTDLAKSPSDVDETNDKSAKPDSINEDQKPAPYGPPSPTQLEKMRDTGDRSIYDTPPFRCVPDYCPVRHRNTIVRLMLLIEGRGVLIDSASRMWTLLALAKIFDCTSVVRDHIVSWIMSGPNARFIEVLPEETLRIGFALKNTQLTQCAFRILVNELALCEAATDPSQHRNKRTTIFGRRIGDCGDELNNIIQHAARALVERVSSIQKQLHSPTLFDEWNIPEWFKLRRLHDILVMCHDPALKGVKASLKAFMELLPQAVALRLDEAIESCDQDQDTLWGMDCDRATYVRPEDFQTLATILPNLNTVQKLLCSFSWNELGERCRWPLYANMRKEDLSLLRKLESALQQASCCVPSTISKECFNARSEDDECSLQLKSPLVDLDRMDWSVKNALQPLALSWIRHDIEPPLNLTRHMLLTLTTDEMKFLPLWAGGFDDGTGGVFESFVPPTNMGPSGPGPAYHTGRSLWSTAPSASNTLLDGISGIRVEGDTTVASVRADDGISTVYRRDAVIAARDMPTTSDSFTTHGEDYDDARSAVPADDQVPRSHQISRMDESKLGADDDGSIEVDLAAVIESSDFEAINVGNAVMSEWSDSDESLVVV